MGSLRDLLFMSLLFVALKLDGIAAYSWSVVFLIPWMWFGALFLGAIVVGIAVLADCCHVHSAAGVSSMICCRTMIQSLTVISSATQC